MAVESLKVLRRRVRSVKNIAQITRAMEMVAAAKLRRAQATMNAARPYARKLLELLANLAEGSELGNHPLFAPREGNRKLLVVFTADRGLAGSYNTNIIKKAEELIKSEPQTNWQLILVGKRGFDYFNRRKWKMDKTVLGLNGQANLEEAQALGKYLVDLFQAGQVDAVHLLYQEFISMAVSRPTVVQYLPMTPEAIGVKKDAGRGRTKSVEYILEPSPDAVFEALLPRLLASRIYITMAEAATSEHSQRMIAMNNATKNSDEVTERLTLKMNNARQATITKELLEIVSGANAIQQG